MPFIYESLDANSFETELCLWLVCLLPEDLSFPSGKPLFGTLISLLDKGVPVLGIIDQPILKERWLGAKGQETTLNGNVHC